MSDALITGLIAIAVCLINNYFQMKQTAKAQATTITLIEYKIQELSDKVAKHNQLVDRMVKCEQETALQDAELKRLNKRVEIVEEKVNE